MSEGRVDREVLPLLLAINSMDGYATTSSCAGRLQLIRVPEVGDKRGSEVLGKWHGPVGADEVLSVIPESPDGAYLMAQPLLVHVRCRDLRSAVELWRIAQGVGLKYTTIRSVQLGEDGSPLEWGLTVEVQGTERMEVPLSGMTREGLLSWVPGWVRHGNDLLARTRSRMESLVVALDDVRTKE